MERLIRRSRSRGGNAGCTQIPSEQRVRTQMYAIIARAVHFIKVSNSGLFVKQGPGRPACAQWAGGAGPRCSHSLSVPGQK